jgi:hypothetical protein
MKWFRRGTKAPDTLAEAGPQRVDPVELAAARDIVRRALDADGADGESQGRDLFRLGTA